MTEDLEYVEGAVIHHEEGLWPKAVQRYEVQVPVDRPAVASGLNETMPDNILDARQALQMLDHPAAQCQQ